MRLLINSNKLPTSCDTTGLEAANVHWHETSNWTRQLPTPRRFVVEAFSNAVNPRAFPGPFFLDIEPDALWGRVDSRQFHRWLNIHTDAIQQTRNVFPKNELFAMDAVGGRTKEQARANVTEAELMLRLLDGVSVSMYPAADGTFTPANEPTLDEYLRLRDAAFTGNRRLQVGIAINDMAGGVQCSIPTFRESIEYGKSRGVDFIIFWQAVRYYGGEVGAAVRIQPYIDALREVAK